jgi:hypothetical protein
LLAGLFDTTSLEKPRKLRNSVIRPMAGPERLDAVLSFSYHSGNRAPFSLISITNCGGFKVSIDTSRGHPEMDYAEHNRTYAGFLTFTKFAILALVTLLAGMFVFLV